MVMAARRMLGCLFVLIVSSCLSVSVFAQCPSLVPPANGYFSPAVVAVGTQVTFACWPGFVVYGPSNMLTCKPSNQWDYPAPQCVVDCANNFILDVNPFTGATTGATVARVELTVAPFNGLAAGVQTGPTVVYQYWGQVRTPAPTILMRAGTTCNVRIINKLQNPPLGNADYNLCPYFANQPHCTNTTNLHVHGLHVAPQEDNVGLSVSPGTFYDYIYHIPDDHHAGTFWYHAHYHGGTSSQVGFMSGALIIDQNESVLATPAEWANLYRDQRVVVFQFLGGPAFPNGPATSFYTANGANNPTITMNSQTWTLFRFIHAAGYETVLSMNLVDASSSCTMTLVARDGIPQSLPFINPQHLILPQGGRADVAIYCGAAAVGAAIHMQSIYTSAHAAFLNNFDVATQTGLFTLNVIGAPYTAQALPVNNKPLPYALQDLTNANAAAATNLVLSFSTGISNVQFAGMGVGAAYVNPTPYQLGQVYSYSITPDIASIFHPYHQHVNALQIQSYSGATQIPEISRVGEWRDVLPIHGNILINVKQKPLDFWGQQVLHCHIFDHEEAGMMGLMQLAQPPTPTCSAYSQPGYTISGSGCGAGTSIGTSCTATCAPGWIGTAVGTVTCQQENQWIARSSYVGQFSNCTQLPDCATLSSYYGACSIGMNLPSLVECFRDNSQVQYCCPAGQAWPFSQQWGNNNCFVPPPPVQITATLQPSSNGQYYVGMSYTISLTLAVYDPSKYADIQILVDGIQGAVTPSPTIFGSGPLNLTWTPTHVGQNDISFAFWGWSGYYFFYLPADIIQMVAQLPACNVPAQQCAANPAPGLQACLRAGLMQWCNITAQIEQIGCFAPASAATSSYCSGTGVVVNLLSGSNFCTESNGVSAAFPSAGTVSSISIQFSTLPTASGIYKLKILEQQSSGSSNFLFVSESVFYPTATLAQQTVQLVTPLQVKAGQFFGFYSNNANVAALPGTSLSYYECGVDFQAASFSSMYQWNNYIPNIQVFYQQGVGCLAPAAAATANYCMTGGTGVIVGLMSSTANNYCTQNGASQSAAFTQAGTITAVAVQFASAPSASGTYKIKVMQQQSANSANFMVVSESPFYPAATTALQTVHLATPLAVQAGQYFGYYSSNVGIAAIPGSSVSYFQCSTDFDATTFTTLYQWGSYIPNIEVLMGPA